MPFNTVERNHVGIRRKLLRVEAGISGMLVAVKPVPFSGFAVAPVVIKKIVHCCSSCSGSVVKTKALADNIGKERNAGNVLKPVDIKMLLILCKRLNLIGKIKVADNVKKTFAVNFGELVCFTVAVIKLAQLQNLPVLIKSFLNKLCNCNLDNVASSISSLSRNLLSLHRNLHWWNCK